MTKSADGSTDLRSSKRKERSSKKKEMTHTNDALKDHNQGSSSGKEMLNMGLQTGTNSGDIEVEELPATGAEEKRPEKKRATADKNYYNNRKARVARCDELENNVGELQKECENLRRIQELTNQNMENNSKWVEEYRSQISQLNSQNESLRKLVDSLIVLLLGKNTIQPDLASTSHQRPVTISQGQHMYTICQEQQQVGINPQCTAVMNDQQPSLDRILSRLVDDFDNPMNQFSYHPAPPQSMQSGGGESEIHN